MVSLFAALTPAELAVLRGELHRGYQAAMPARCEPLMTDLSYLIYEVARAEQGREWLRAVERYWSGA